jgi:hypothetical protein
MFNVTFKAQAKSNAKRFLVKTCKIDETLLDKFLTQHEGEWGTWVDAEGTPVAFAALNNAAPVDERFENSVESPEDGLLQNLPHDEPAEDREEEPADEAPAAPSAFGSFAMAQLTAPSNSAAVEPARASREGATPTSGLKIQKDRPEQNGVRRQSAGSVGDKLWTLYDAAGKDVTLEQAKAMAMAAGLSPTSAAIALYNWRRFHGVQSRSAK